MWLLLILELWLVGLSRAQLEAATHGTVHIHDLNGDEHKRHHDSGLPDYLEFKFKRGEAEGETVLRLTKTKEQVPSVDMRMFGVDGVEIGQPTEDEGRRLERMKHYIDESKSGSFLVTCKIAETGPCTRHITGHFTMGDTHYEIEPAYFEKQPVSTRTVKHVLRQEDAKKFNSEQFTDDMKFYSETSDDAVTSDNTHDVIDDVSAGESNSDADAIPLDYPNFIMPGDDKESSVGNTQDEAEKDTDTVKEKRQFPLSFDMNVVNGYSNDIRKMKYTVELSIIIDGAYYDKIFPMAHHMYFMDKKEDTPTDPRIANYYKSQTTHLLRNRVRMLILGMSRRLRRLALGIRVTLKKMLVFTSMNGTFLNKNYDDYDLSRKVIYDPAPKQSVKQVGGIQYIDGGAYIVKVHRWFRGKVKAIYKADHLMVLTGYDLTKSGDPGQTGYTYLGAICTRDSLSIVETAGSMFLTSTRATHELAHSLGAVHDWSSECPTWGRYIMKPGTHLYPFGLIKGNYPWRFSACSKGKIKLKLRSLGTEAPKNCLLNDEDFEQYDQYGSWYKSRHMQYSMAYNSQCKFIQGINALLCDQSKNVAFTGGICRELRCSKDCDTVYFAANETMCSPLSEHKICLDGMCTEVSLKGFFGIAEGIEDFQPNGSTEMPLL